MRLTPNVESLRNRHGDHLHRFADAQIEQNLCVRHAALEPVFADLDPGGVSQKPACKVEQEPVREHAFCRKRILNAREALSFRNNDDAIAIKRVRRPEDEIEENTSQSDKRTENDIEAFHFDKSWRLELASTLSPPPHLG